MSSLKCNECVASVFSLPDRSQRRSWLTFHIIFHFIGSLENPTNVSESLREEEGVRREGIGSVQCCFDASICENLSYRRTRSVSFLAIFRRAAWTLSKFSWTQCQLIFYDLTLDIQWSLRRVFKRKKVSRTDGGLDSLRLKGDNVPLIPWLLCTKANAQMESSFWNEWHYLFNSWFFPYCIGGIRVYFKG